MNRTLRICFWVLLLLGVYMTVFMNLHAMDSVLHPGILLPLALLPYLVLALIARYTRTIATLAIALATALTTLCVGFWIYCDGLFVRYTTLNAPLFIEVPILQLVPVMLGGALIWWGARREGIKKATA
jgi:hypothetical protein